MDKEMTHTESAVTLRLDEPFRSAFFPQRLSLSLQITDLCFRLVIGVVFFVAGALKVGDPAKFQQDILNYHLVPHVVAAAMAVYLPWLEMICAVALVLRKCYSGALAILSGLMVIFFIAYLQAIVRGINLSCGCFGKFFEDAPSWIIITRDMFFLTCLGLLWMVEVKNNATVAREIKSGDLN